MRRQRPQTRRPRPTPRSARRVQTRSGARAGFALLMAMMTVAILAVLVTEFHSNTGTAFAAANMQRDRLKAEYLARSGVNLTRMLLSQERNLRKLVDGPYRAIFGTPAPQIPVWEFADYILRPFADLKGSETSLGEAGFDVGLVEGLGDLGGTFTVIGSAENSKLNVSRHLRNSEPAIKSRIGKELFARFGGLQSPSPYDNLFSEADDKGRTVTRPDLIGNLIDWWDADQKRSMYDPGTGQVVESGGEDDSYYREQEPPYSIKNAPLDTFEELHLVHGMTDDIWATFADPEPNDPRERQMTVYGTGSVNPNGADPAVVLAAICDYELSQTVTLCSNFQEAYKFVTVLRLARSMFMNAPLFGTEEDFIKFMEGRGQLYEQAQLLFGSMPNLAWTPVTFPKKQREALKDKLVMQASIVTIQATAHVGRARKRLRVVVNTHGRWTPPPGTTGSMSPLGILHYFRFD